MSMFEIWIGKVREINGDYRRDVRLMITVEFIRQHLRHFKGAKYAVFTVIAGHMNDEGWAWPSNELISVETGYTDKNTISTAITQLKALKIEKRPVLLVIERRNSKGHFLRNEYLVFPTDNEIKLHREGKLNRLTQPDSEAPYRGFPDTVSPDTVNPPQSIDSNTPESKDSSTNKGSALPPKSNKYPQSDEVKNAFALLCYNNLKAWDLNASTMAGALGKLSKAEQRSLTVQDLRDFYSWWKKSDWRGKSKQLPDPYTVVSVWARFRAGESTTPDMTERQPPKPKKFEQVKGE